MATYSRITRAIWDHGIGVIFTFGLEVYEKCLLTLGCFDPWGNPLNPPPSGIIRIQEDRNIIPIIPYGHCYWVGGPPNQYRTPGSYHMRTPAFSPSKPGACGTLQLFGECRDI